MASAVRRAGGIAALGAALAAPATADAARLDVQGNELRYEAAGGEANALRVVIRDGSVTFTETGATIDGNGSGGACEHPSGASITCSLSGGLRVKVKLGDRDDSAEVVSGKAKLYGDEGNDRLIGGPGDDELNGDPGDDFLQGRGGRDTFQGGEGFDQIDYLDHAAPVTASFDGVANDGSAGENEMLPVDAEFVFGSPQGDTLSAGPAGSALHGGPGPDLLLGGAGDDIIYGGKDADELRGDGGVDRMWGDLGPDRVVAADGIAESVECGGDFDWVNADALDTLSGCEDSVEAPAGGPDGSGAPQGGGFGAGAPPQPQLGRTVTVEPATGNVTIRPPGGTASPLTAGDDIPVGSIVDTTRGAVDLTSAAGAGGGTQTARFKGGVFQVRQTDGTGKPVTELVLKGSVPSCGRGKVVAAAKRRTRRLWGSGHGRFRTRGRHGSATVRGTIWLTEDRCEGTYTRVKRGVVAVKDFARKRTVLVRAGESYLARRR